MTVLEELCRPSSTRPSAPWSPPSPPSFVTSGSVEEDILERAKKKMVLDHLVIQVRLRVAVAVAPRASFEGTAWPPAAAGNVCYPLGAARLLCRLVEPADSRDGRSPNQSLAPLFPCPHALPFLPSPPQRMDTSGRTVLGAGGGQEQAKQMFGKVGRRLPRVLREPAQLWGRASRVSGRGAAGRACPCTHWRCVGSLC